MKKFIIILIIVVSSVSFSLLLYRGYRHLHGVPVIDKEAEKTVLEVRFVDKNINLTKGIDRSFWDAQRPQTIELFYQVMVLPWPKKVIPSVNVSAFHNKKDIYFYLEWTDATEDDGRDIDVFSDACAVMFPLQKDVPSSSLMMGFMGKANIWQWKAAQNLEYWTPEKKKEKKVYVDFYYPFEEDELFVVSKQKYTSAVNDLVAIRVATITHKTSQKVTGRGSFSNNVWRVVFRRSLEPVDQESSAQFKEDNNLCAFAVWDGSHGDRGGRKSITNWVELRLE